MPTSEVRRAFTKTARRKPTRKPVGLGRTMNKKENKQEVWVRWHNGKVERVDALDSESEALDLLQEFRNIFGASVASSWLQLKRD